MKRRILLFCLAALLCIAAVVTYRYRAAIFRSGEASELFVRYQDTPGVDATFIKGFQVNDTLALDVTLLEATDSMGWETLIADFQIPKIFITGRDDHVSSWRLKKGQTCGDLDTVPENNDQIIVADGMHTISIFHITDKNQFYPILHKHTNELIEKKHF